MSPLGIWLLAGGMVCHTLVLILYLRMLKSARKYDKDVAGMAAGPSDAPLPEQAAKRFRGIIGKAFLKPLGAMLALTMVGLALEIAVVVLRVMSSV